MPEVRPESMMTRPPPPRPGPRHPGCRFGTRAQPDSRRSPLGGCTCPAARRTRALARGSSAPSEGHPPTAAVIRRRSRGRCRRSPRSPAQPSLQILEPVRFDHEGRLRRPPGQELDHGRRGQGGGPHIRRGDPTRELRRGRNVTSRCSKVAPIDARPGQVLVGRCEEFRVALGLEASLVAQLLHSHDVEPADGAETEQDLSSLVARGRPRDGLLEQCPGPHRIAGIEVVLGRLHGSATEVVTALNGGEPPASSASSAAESDAPRRRARSAASSSSDAIRASGAGDERARCLARSSG